MLSNTIKFLALLVTVFFAVMLSPAAAPSGDRDEVSAALLRAEADSASEFMITVWQTGEGLPVNVVRELQQSPDGYLWLGTLHGLIRFDGVRFQSFLTTPAGSRYGSRFGPMQVDRSRRMWITPDQVGLVLYHEGKFFEVQTNGLALRARAESVCDDGAGGMLWVDALGGVGRVSIADPSKAEKFDFVVPGGSRWIRDFDGNLWVESPRALSLFRDNVFHRVEPSGGMTLVTTPRRKGGLWMSRSGELHVVSTNGVMEAVCEFPWRGEPNRVLCMLEDSNGTVWIGSASSGLYCYQSGSLRQVVPTVSSVLCLFEDREGNIWAGTRGGGLIRVRPRYFHVLNSRSGLDREFVNSLAQDNEGRVWIASAEGGLAVWQNERARPVSLPAASTREVLCVAPAVEGGVWISFANREIWRWKDEIFSPVTLPPRFLREPAVDLLEDRQGRLWMVTDNSGLICLQGGAIRHYSERHGLPSNLVRRLIEDENGQLWVGDWEGGVSRFSGEGWELVRKPSGHQDAIRSMVAADGTLWIGTSAGGLLRLRNGQTSRVSVAQGLPDSCIQQLLLDGRGFLWGGTSHRLFRISLEELESVMDGDNTKIQTITFGRTDGLTDTSFSSWSDPRSCRAANGELWFATANGAVHFHPENLPVSKPPRSLIEEVLLNSEPIPVQRLQTLRPGAGRIEFRYTAPCLTASDRVRFRYRLATLDQDWVDAGTDRTATYASIPAGKHEFQVIACSPDGVWDTVPAVVALAVHPHFWQTNWFLASSAAVLAGSGVWIARRAAVRRLRRRLESMRQQHAVDKERARIAQDIHDELGANLTSIGLLADMGLRHASDPAAAGREFQQISEAARESVAAMDAIVWALNPRNDSLDHFANYIAQFTRDFFRPAGLRTRLELPPDLPTLPMTTEMRHELFLLVKESFNNVARHAEAKEVSLELACEKGSLRLTISDDGKGLPEQTSGEGRDGLLNLQERIERLGGNLVIQSRLGEGTKLDFRLPLSHFKAIDV